MKHPIDSITKFRNIQMNGFTTSLSFCKHPLVKTRKKTKHLYFAALEYLTRSCAIHNEYADARLSQYRMLLIGENVPIVITCANCDVTMKLVIDDFMKPWKRKYCPLLLCDIALIILEETSIKKAHRLMSKYLNGRKSERLNELLDLLFNDIKIPAIFAGAENLITQFRINRVFSSQTITRVMVTANMSAGKSTFINALIGKPIVRASQETCTANLCYLYNKPFEDDRLHLIASPLNLNATHDDLMNVERESVSSIASYFRTTEHSQRRLCLIDTPGVNSALNSDHGERTRKAIVEEEYDKLIYILDAGKLGTDGEMKHLKYVYKNVPAQKVIFVINKLDCFNNADDSISDSYEQVKTDLCHIGFEHPKVFLLSAYFSLLLKIKYYNETLNDDEQDIYNHYIKKFRKPEYNLSSYYDKTLADESQIAGELPELCSISGLYALEKLLFGGTGK